MEKSPPSPTSSSSSPSSSSGTSSSSCASSSSDDDERVKTEEEEKSGGSSESNSNQDDDKSKPAYARFTCSLATLKLNNDDDNTMNKTKKTRKWEKHKGGQLFIKRIWSLPDEIAILRGLVEYQMINGPIPMSATGIGKFLATIADSLSIAVNNSQLVDKIRRLRKRYMFANRRGKNGEAPKFSKPHNHSVYTLSMGVWGCVNGQGDGGRDESEAMVEEIKEEGAGDEEVLPDTDGGGGGDGEHGA